jgi:hypothetical protein
LIDVGCEVLSQVVVPRLVAEVVVAVVGDVVVAEAVAVAVAVASVDVVVAAAVAAAAAVVVVAFEFDHGIFYISGF